MLKNQERMSTTPVRSASVKRVLMAWASVNTTPVRFAPLKEAPVRLVALNSAPTSSALPK